MSQRYDQPGYRGYVLGILVLAYAFNFLDRYILIILQEPIRAEFSLSDTQLGLMTGFAFAMFYVTLGLPIARFADKGSRRLIISAAVALWSLMTAISGLAQNYAQLLAARIGVAVGEAGGSPPAHSMISDIFPQRSRATALAIYSIGINLGILLGYLAGGWINEFFGWRMAFFVVGVPGLLLALLVLLTVREPARGQVDGVREVADAPSLGETVRFLWSRRSFRYLSIAGGVQCLAGYGIDSWVSPYVIRSFGMGTGEVGTWMGLLAIPGAVGTFLGGWLCDRLRSRDVRWYLWAPAIAGLIMIPATTAVFLVGSGTMALALYAVPSALLTFYLAPSVAISHEIVSLRMRALSSAVLFFMLNFIGLGFGPLLIGAASDWFEPTLGEDSLRVALIIGSVAFNLGAAALFFLASRSLKEDLERPAT